MQRHLINGSFHISPNLTGHAVAVLVIHEQICQITVPKISIKAMRSRKFQQAVHTVIKKRPVLLLPIMFHQIYHIMQQIPLCKIFIDDQLLDSHFYYLLLFVHSHAAFRTEARQSMSL